MFAASKSGRAAAAAPTSDTLFPYVPLLLNTTSTNGQQNNTFLDSSTNNFTITRNGTPAQGSVTPYWPVGYWSNNFNGSSDYLTAGTSTCDASQFGTSNFTVEMWIQPQSAYVSGAEKVIYGSGTTGCFGLRRGTSYASTTDGLSVFRVAQNDWEYVTYSFSTGVWYHIAVVRTSGVIAIYINGQSQTVSSSGGGANNWSTLGAVQIGAQPAGSSYFGGYISNLRVVKGVAVYTGAFTVPTTPLAATQSSGTNIAAITGTATSLLACQNNRFIDNSTNSFAIAASGTPKAQAFQPFSPTASYTAAAYGGSGYLNGSTDYLTTPTNTAFAFGTGDFTIEFWIYLNATGGILLDFRPSTTNGVYPTIYNPGGATTIAFLTDSANRIVSASGVIVTGTWIHVAVSRSSGSTKMFVNGSQVGSTYTDSNNYLAGTSRPVIGASGFDLTGNFNGYISNLRLVKGTAVYTANFTPPTAPVTAITNTSLLLNCTNAGIYDAAVQNNAITVGDAQASTTVSKWSPTSMKFDGTGDWLTAIDGPQLQLGTGDFTIDGWLYLSANGVVYGLVSKGTATTGWSVNVTVLNKLQFSYTTSNLTGTTTLATGTWYYFAVVRSGSATGNLKVYLNGSVEATSGGAVTDNFNQTNILYVGADRVGAMPVNGYLQDIRVTKAARTITTPTAAFPTR
jgi:hypothetical protein